MRIDRLLIIRFFLAASLAGCAAHDGSISSNPGLPDARATHTSFLTVSDTPAPASDTPTPEATQTATLAPLASPPPSKGLSQNLLTEQKE